MKKIFIISSFLSLILLGCYQEEGQRCEITEDCDTGLMCCTPAGAKEGTCRTSEDCPNGNKK
ncbi:hypothetical protein KKF84_10105 [Myxococcota bacterium]|nr:hypothetical protein [Myxococcota bacterium]MBU1535664.1 hypothetical protein [Myxococcota bacterium]